MDFQQLVDGMAAMTCVMSVEKRENGYGDIRIVTGNRAYIDSIEKPEEGVELLTKTFVPNSLYTNYFTQDLNFEDFCYRSAVHKKCLHSYVQPDRIPVWFNLTFLPVNADDGDLCYCTYTMEIDMEPDSGRMSNISGDLASKVVETAIKLRTGSDFKSAINYVIGDIRESGIRNREIGKLGEFNMKYRRLGKTDLNVSEIGFGAEWIGDWPQERVNEVVRACEAAGVNIVDCWMADPAIRNALGEALEENRNHWIIQGHIGSTWQNGQYTRTREMGPVREAFDEQLRLLRTDHVELGMIHYVDAIDEFRTIMDGEFFQYVQELLAAGRIEHIGLSTHNPNVALEAVKHPEIEMIMFSVNPVFDLMPAVEDEDILFAQKIDSALAGIELVRAELYAACERADVGITCMKPFAGGRLLDAGKSPFGVAMTPAQCISYCLGRPAVASVLAGYGEPDHLEEALAYYDASPDELNYASILAEAPQHAYYGKCIYCGHCQPCVVGINIAQTNKFYDLAIMQDEVPQGVRDHYENMDATAGDCIGCRSCEPNCPFGVRIADQMEKTAELFGR